MAKSRGRIIDDLVIEVIEHLLDTWEGKLTWDLLIAAIKASIATQYTRQALANHERIAHAFSDRQKALRNREESPLPGNPQVAALMKKIETLEAENARLQLECQRHRAMFIRWVSNAQKKNLTAEELNAELPPAQRRATSEENVVPLTKARKKTRK